MSCVARPTDCGSFALTCRQTEESVLLNELKPFSPSIDWGEELLHSLIWLAEAWTIAAICTQATLVLLARYTAWGRYQSNDLYSTAQIAVQGFATGNLPVKDSGMQEFWIPLLNFSLLAAILVTRVLVDLFMAQRFMLAWLTDRLTGDWLDGQRLLPPPLHRPHHRQPLGDGAWRLEPTDMPELRV